jgi:hypothetical protein
MSKEKIEKCAIQVLNKLNYTVEETVPYIEGSIFLSEMTELTVRLNLGKQEFEPTNSKHVEKIKPYLDTLNRRFKACLNASL